jgi:septal ring factor EnvC (AmiA/AmiB activator)
MMSLFDAALVVGSSILGGLATTIYAGIKETKKEKQRQIEREQDMLKMEIKDKKIELYELEKQLTEWKDKYYSVMQELIHVKAELENALSQLNILELQELDSE